MPGESAAARVRPTTPVDWSPVTTSDGGSVPPPVGSRPRTPRPVPLSGLADLVGRPSSEASDVVVSGLTLASAEVCPGDLYAALPGARTHGVRYVGDAVERGAVAVLTDPSGRQEAAATGLPVCVVDDPRAVLGEVADRIYDRPSERMQVIGITGTNGKTTTAYLVEAGLAAAGRATGLIGTVQTQTRAADGGVTALPSVRTTPEAPAVHALLAAMAEAGVSSVVMEVSSHALVLGRVGAVRFAAAGFTNLGRDHLDFHGDLEEYFRAKSLLFDGRAAVEVVDVDDEHGRRLLDRPGRPRPVTVSTEGAHADWRATDVAPGADGGSTFTLHGPDGLRRQGSVRLPGRFNVANAVLAVALLDAVGVPVDAALEGIASTVVPGRMEPVEAGQPFVAAVDYAHTPDAVATALGALRTATAGRLITVLGCGGDRDPGKRAAMGAAAAAGSDVLVVTDDNPRSEEPAVIRAAMLAGVLDVPEDRRAEVHEVGDRREAIAAAVALARPGDTVLVAGKGHETGQEIAGTVHPFDDRAVLREVLAAGVPR
ncbi:UDP-N-acetylmuramoylalanyl-D-glutamate--2,6-diaminopimelate ligase [Blastococcus aggregatus]|uniref:UDP-N-acetylmuramoyl-L-alanyl-D-glutamate--2,6-diaminopimelate ligase n=1 Tax=Blastococcus aggregatus TaxID=38502 RepID=A0A285VDZ5_9ACTN|nr:UDP-N-acetylmuramoylalanyl-D-glutamate--2,6-diaminopimelate ligase [Blastococcus aggregatus]